ncbi:MAG: helix-turn-helix domain-containing protein [Solirubrobacteraceae bacterium]
MTPPGRHCRCGTLLAGDNAGTLCGVCQQKPSRHRAPAVPPEFWHTDVMVDALASGDLGRVIRAYRFHPFHGRRPLSQTVVSDWLCVSQTALSRIEQGKCRLTMDDIDWFTRTLGMPWALRWVPQHEAKEDVDPLSRRSLFGAGVGAAFGLGATTAPTAAREIDPELVSHWRTLLLLLDRHGAMFGSHEVVGTVRRELDLIAEHRRIVRGDLRTDLLRMESRWSEFGSWLSNDVGDPRLRDYEADRALRLAQEAGYADMVAWVLLRHSQWAVDRLDAQQAIACAQTAGHTPGTTDHMRGLCALREAHAHALGNDAASCERSLAAAYGLLDADTAVPPDLGTQYANPSYVTAAEARCWLLLRPHKAMAMFEDALRLWPHDRTRRRGTEQARLALACAAAEEPERAAAEGVKALSIAHATKSDGIVRELKRLDRQLAGYELPAVADFREAVAAL